MKRARIGIIAAAIFAVASVAFAQKPDFSGTWTLDPEASGMAAPAGGGGGGGGRGGGALGNGPATVKQTADTLTIERTMGDNKVTLTYKLDGSESKNTMMGRGGHADGVGVDGQVRRRQAHHRHQAGHGRADGRDDAELVARRQRADGREHERSRHAEARLQEDHVVRRQEAGGRR